MSVNVGTYTAAAGQGVALFDAVLPLNAYWSIFDDSVGTNQKTYRCTGDGKMFYFEVRDNQADYFTCYLWEGWDADTHAGIGLNSGVYMRKIAGAYCVVLRDTYFIYMTYGSNTTHAYYCGHPVYYDTARNSPILIGHGTTGVTSDPIGYLGSYSNTSYWKSIRIDDSITETSLQSDAADDTGTSHKFYAPKTSRNIIMPERPIRYGSDNVLFGYLDGAWSAGYGTGAVPLHGQQFLIDGVLWKTHYSARPVFIRMQ